MARAQICPGDRRPLMAAYFKIGNVVPEVSLLVNCLMIRSSEVSTACDRGREGCKENTSARERQTWPQC